MATLTNSSNDTSDGVKVVGYDMGDKVGHYMALIDTSGNVISSLPIAIDQTTSGTTNGTYQTGSAFSIKSAPVVGAKTITTTAASIFAGSSMLSNRYIMTVYNESSYTIYCGPSGVTTSTGFPVLPGDSIAFQFDPATATAIYVIAAASAAIRVMEVA